MYGRIDYDIKKMRGYLNGISDGSYAIENR